jgi:dynein heavy chain
MIESVGVCLVHLQPYPKEVKSFTNAWKGGGQKLLGKMGILQTLTNYDLDSLNDKKIRNVKKEINRHGGDMTVERVTGMSYPAGGLFAWVWNLVAYYAVAKEVKPLQDKVKHMEKEQMESEKQLDIINAKLAALMAELAELDENFNKLNGELTVLSEQAADMEKKLNAASKLITGLGGERKRWAKQVVDMKASRGLLVGDCLLAASFLSYLGAFTFDYRTRLLDSAWVTDLSERKVPHTDNFSVRSLLASDATVQGWIGEGLPADDNSVQNAILATKSSRFPLCIDPQEQALRWIINREKAHGLRISTFSSGDFMKYVELSVNMGFPFLFQNVSEAIDPVIDPILEKNTFIVSQQKMIRLGDADVTWDDNFRLYLTTKLANPRYSPEVMGKTMIINFAVTLDGLRDQLLNDVVANERPELDTQWNELVSSTAANTKMLLELEDDLLHRLATSTGNLLDDYELIAALEQTKKSSTEIKEQLSQAAFTKDEIQTTRTGYTPAAKRGAIVFFCMQGLSKIRKMYEFALGSYRTVFKRSLKQATRSVVLESRIVNIINELTRQSYDFTCTGIFEAHKLLFSFQLTTSIMAGEGELNRNELDIFLKGDTSLDDPKRRCPNSWLSKSNWKDTLKVDSLGGGFAGLADSVTEDDLAWRAWYDLVVPEEHPFPSGFTDKLNPFQQLLIYRCFRPDRAYNAVKKFVAGKMGEKYVRPPNLEFQRVFDQSTPLNPIVFILSPGADPQSGIDALGRKLGFTTQNNRYKFLALGSGQGPKAEMLLKTGKVRGHWVLLQNSHLLLSWLGYVEGFLEGCVDVAPHEDFRLWMTTDPTDYFPLGILQLAYKVVTEPPDGLMLNMSNAYAQLTEEGGQEMIDDCPHDVFAPVLFVLCFLHAVVLDRRKYGKIGWNVSYDFNDSDFNVSRRLLKMYLRKAVENGEEDIPWDSLKFLMGDAMYGGRVSDDFDRRILTTYCNEFFGDFLFDTFQQFFFSRDGHDYQLPPQGSTFEDYVRQVHDLPLTSSPAVFGLHPNAEIGYFNNRIRDMWRGLILLQPRVASSASGFNVEEYKMKTAKDIESKVPPPTDMLMMKTKFGIDPTPTQIVLLQELARFNLLVDCMAVSLSDLQRALLGEIGMSAKLESLGDSLLNGFLPQMWKRFAPDTDKGLVAWINHFQCRQDQFTSWGENGTAPVVMWMAGMTIPESFLTALVQQVCRANQWPLDKVDMYTRVSQFLEAQEVGVQPLEGGHYVSGLFLEGARWDVDEQCLREQLPKVLVQRLPILEVYPVEASRISRRETFRTPVYVTQRRRNAMGVGLCFEADIASDRHESHWILQGVALCLNVESDTL